MTYNCYRSPEENKGLFQKAPEGYWYCVDSDVPPGQEANSGFKGFNDSNEHKSMWILADENNCYARTEWRDPVRIGETT